MFSAVHKSRVLPKIASVVFLLSTLLSCATVGSDGRLAGIDVSADSDSLVLIWSENTPVSQLLRPGTTVDVVAEYGTPAGRVTGEPLASGRIAAGSNAVTFKLPSVVKNAPNGSICLRFRTAGRLAIPIRPARDALATDGFRYPAWESNAQSASKRPIVAARLAALEAQSNSDAGRIEAFAAWRKQQGVESIEGCDKLTQGVAVRPPDVLEVKQHVYAAQRECVWRLEAFATQRVGMAGTTALLDLIDQILAQDLQRAGTDPANAAIRASMTDRAQQLKSIRATALSLRAAIQPPFVPLVLADPLSLKESIRVKENQSASAYAGAIADAFNSCLRDEQDQFRVKLETWQREQDPRLSGGKVNAARNSCRARFNDESRKADRASGRQPQIDQLRAELAAIPTTPVVLRGKVDNLSSNRCEAQ